jgi:signal peptidase I
MMLKNLMKKWDKYTEGWFGTIVYLFLGFVIAYSFNLFLGYTLKTDTPVVAVYSCSMEHNTYNNWWQNCGPLPPESVCGKNATGYDTSNFDDYWRLCGSWYESKNISKAEFETFPFKNGLDVGDMVVVANTNDVKVGDIIIFSTGSRSFPIIHRAVSIDDSITLTKGDNNGASDSFVDTKIHGKAILKIPILGWVKILFTQITGIP